MNEAHLDADETDPRSEYLAINLANWNSRVPHHVHGYGLDRYSDPAYLSEVIRFDRPRLGDVSGLDVVHLQCHIGTDTVSLTRLGARSVTGLDFSQPALDAAAEFADANGATVRWVQSDVHDALDVLEPESFDLVYTGIGALCWLPRADRWAEIVAGLLRPGGRLFIREGHPMLWSLCDPREDQLVVIEFPYFESDGTVFVEEETYVEQQGPIESPTTVGFNHSLGEIFNALWRAGLTITAFEEHWTVPWNPLAEAFVEVPDLPGEFELRDTPKRLAATYTLQARKARPERLVG